MTFTWVDVLLTFSVLCLGVIIWYDRIVKRYKRLGINYLEPTFLFGNMLKSLFGKKHLGYIIKDAYDSFPDDRFFVYFEMAKPVILIKDLELLKSITIKNFEKFADHRTVIMDEEIDLWLGNSLFLLRGKKWREMRNAMAPAFTPSRMKKMSLLVSKAAHQMRDYFLEEIKSGRAPVLEIEGKTAFTAYFNDLLAMAGFGIHVDSHRDEKNSFLQEAIRLTDLGFWRGIKYMGFGCMPKVMNMLRIPIIENECGYFFKDIVLDAIKQREKDNIRSLDFLDQIIQTKKAVTLDKGNELAEKSGENLSSEKSPKIKWSDNLLAAQATVFMIGGLDTGSNSTSNLFYELAMNPDIQKRLQEDIDHALSKDGEFNYDNVQDMELLNMVILETMRLHTSGIPVMDRICEEEFNIGPPRPGAKSHTLKKGDGIAFSPISFHTDPKYWTEPLKFNPERFSKENRHNIVPYSYVPFGIGPRICIGNRFAEFGMKLAACFMLSVFDIVRTDRTPDILHVTPKSMTMRAESYYYGIKLRERN